MDDQSKLDFYNNCKLTGKPKVLAFNKKFGTKYKNRFVLKEIIYKLRLKYKNKEQKKIQEEIKKDILDIKEKTKYKDLNNKYDVLIKENELLENKIEMILGIKNGKSESNNYSDIQTLIKGESTAFIICSDWHLEELVDPSTINNMNSFNIEIGRKRVGMLFYNGLKLTNAMAKETKIHNIVLGLLGDFISGYIHEELEENNSLSPLQSLIEVKQAIIDGIDYLLNNSKYNITVVTSFGNHGRTTQKTRIATGYKNNYEWFLYNILRDYYINNKRINFVIENGIHTYLKVYDYKIRFHHGDNIKYGGGIGGITIPINKAIHSWNKVKYADLDVFGHFHQLGFSKNFISNGSLIGYYGYALSIKAEYEEPQQAFFLIHEKYFRTIQAKIILDTNK